MVQTISMLYGLTVVLGDGSNMADENQYETAGEDIYNFSSESNVLHLMLDAFQTDVFDDLINHESLGQRYRKELKGFVFFNETLGTFPYTRFTIASFIGNKIYQNDTPKDDFNAQVFAGDNIFNKANESQFDIDFVSNEYWSKFHTQGSYENLYIHKNKKNDFLTTNAIFLFDLSLFRMAPFQLKKVIYNEQNWLLSSVITSDAHMRFEHFKNLSFMDDLISKAQANRDKPVYKYIHLMTPHRPLVVMPDCNFSGGILAFNRLNITIQSKCTLEKVIELFKKMKEIGVYDKTLIVMHSDHGSLVQSSRQQRTTVVKNLDKPLMYEFIARASPLLAIKPINADLPFKTSTVQASLSDIPDTISDLMNWGYSFGSESVFNLDNEQDRLRYFYYYDWQTEDAWTTDYTGPIYKYEILGSHYDTPWQLKEVLKAPPE